MKLVSIFLFVVIPILAQTGGAVRVSDDTSPSAVQNAYVVTGTSITAVCTALSSLSSRINNIISISAISKASPAIVTSTGHGFDTNSRPLVTISGATGTGWTTVNATFIATVIDANTFSLYTTAGVAFDSSGFGTLGGTVVFTTTGPRKTVAEWAVKRIAYDGSGNAIWSGWLNGNTSYTNKCSEASSTTLVQQ